MPSQPPAAPTSWPPGIFEQLVTAPQLVRWLRYFPLLGYFVIGSHLLVQLGNLSRGNVNLGTPFDAATYLAMGAFLLLPFDASPLYAGGLPAGLTAAQVPYDPRLGQPGLFRLLTRWRRGLISMLLLNLATLGLYRSIWLVRRFEDFKALGRERSVPRMLLALPLGIGLLRLSLVITEITGLTSASSSRLGLGLVVVAVVGLWWLESVFLALAASRIALGLDPAVAPLGAPAPRWALWLAPTYALEKQFDGLRVRVDAKGKAAIVAHAPGWQPIGLLAVAGLLLSGVVAWALASTIVNLRAEQQAVIEVLARRHEAWPQGDVATVEAAERILETDLSGANAIAAAHALVGNVRGAPALRARAALVNARVRLYGGTISLHEVGKLELGSAGLSVKAALALDAQNPRAWVLSAWVAHLAGDVAGLQHGMNRARALAPRDPKLVLLEQHLAQEAGGKLQEIGGLL